MFDNNTVDARIRRKAKKLGWRVEKSRTRLVHSNDQGMYQLIDERNVVVGGSSYEASCAEIEFWIDDGLRKAALN